MNEGQNGKQRKWFYRSKKQTSEQEVLFPELEPRPKPWYMKWWLWLITCLVVLFGSIGIVVYARIQAFETAANLSIGEMYRHIQTARSTPIPEAGFTILLYGIDETINQREGSLLTDSIMLLNIKPNNQINLISIPRDLWIDSLKTKINALYYYGEISDDTTGQALLTQVVEDITGKKIDFHVQLNLELVREMIDAVGGINVNVPQGFRDERFPREGVDITSTDPAVLYETVVFESGPQHMDGTRALKYIRSRQSEDLSQGNDGARSERQQQVIMSLISELRAKDWLNNLSLAGSLIKLWQQEVPQDIPLPIVIRIALNSLETAPAINTHQLPVRSNGTDSGILYHPPVEKYSQWVYEPIDPTWKELEDYVSTIFSR